jgi:hypothetical protein
MEWSLSSTSVLYGSGVYHHSKEHVRRFRSWLRSPRALEQIRWWNGIADLAVLLEPIYWHRVVENRTRSAHFPQLPGVSPEYKREALDLLRRIYKARVAQAHEELRWEASRMDPNGSLYLLLRTSLWYKREQLRGPVAGALWLRHMAEVLRHGFDEIYEDRLVHEDESSSSWYPGARAGVYGSEYPLDDLDDLAGRLVRSLGVSSIRARIYVEGPTEEGALREFVNHLLGSWVEIVNLRAQFGSRKGGGYLQNLRAEIERDLEAKRFSFIAIDGDNQDIRRSLSALASENMVVGMILMPQTDFESHFTRDQQMRAIQLKEQMEDAFYPELDLSLFDEAQSGRELESIYVRERQAQGLKGESWGRALARVAFSDAEGKPEEDFPFVHFAASCIRATTSNYDSFKHMHRIDPGTFRVEQVLEKPW